MLARRARRVFGPPRPWPFLMSRGVAVEKVNAPVRGEWLRAPGVRANAAILYIHGGGYVSCSPTTHRPISATLARETRVPVFSVDYRLAPEHPFPAAIDDVFASYQFLLKRGVPANRIAVGGDSAGGGLALALCVRARAAGVPLPVCVFTFSPWADLAGTGDSLRTNAESDVMFAPGNVHQFAQAMLGDASTRNPLASPVFASLHDMPATLLEVGRDEQLFDDARRVHDKITNAGGNSTLVIVDGVFHGWQLCARLVPEADRSLANAAAFIQKHIPA